ncbi:MAG: hypothetical protein WC142_04505 [Bacteroidales bacterium]|jgi:hypothetical protein|nr:hypothetical protein [Bacteroidales bacterium]MDD3330872.1 hypothetical protein [Bacteroidales bacterium]MDD3691692.1 hypothetical protein [Bacteroidales bacterium]MDD4044569.1 hypothetical protein [Bacteroidales bacterium]
MRKIFLIAILTIGNLSVMNASDLNNNLIELAKIYRNFMFRNSPTTSTFEQLAEIKSSELMNATKFIKETITTGNKLTTTEFLKLPDETTLKYIYIIRRINWNITEEQPKDNNKVITELTDSAIPRYELIDNYYEMLFIGVGNKNQPFNLSGVDFQMNKYELQDNTEKGIFFLNAMNLCGTLIWGYMNIVKPPNYKKALQYIKKYPKFNGQPYYQYLDFGFPDFEMVIIKDKGKESYKSYYINRYYNTLLSHLECLSQKKKDKEKRIDLLLGSILKVENYYKYSKKKKVLKELFTTMKR